MLRRLGIRAKVMAVLAVPMIVLLAAGGFISWNAIQELRYAKAADSVITTLQAYTPVSELAAGRAAPDAQRRLPRGDRRGACSDRRRAGRGPAHHGRPRPEPVPAAGRRPVRRGPARAQHGARPTSVRRRHQGAARPDRQQLRLDHRGPAQPHGAGRQQPREPRPGAVRHRVPRDRHHRRQPGRRDDRRYRAADHPRAGPCLGPCVQHAVRSHRAGPWPRHTPPWTRWAWRLSRCRSRTRRETSPACGRCSRRATPTASR